MNTTNSRNFRIDLKHFLDLASKEPVRVQRGASESFVVMNESHFSAIRSDMNSMQKRLVELLEGNQHKKAE